MATLSKLGDSGDGVRSLQRGLQARIDPARGRGFRQATRDAVIEGARRSAAAGAARGRRRAPADLLAAARFDEVADQLDAMPRLWDPATLPGLVQGRHDEARLWRSGFAALQLD